MILFYDLLVFGGGLVLILMGVTQVVIPMFLNRPIFPLFRSAYAQEVDLAKAHQDVADALLKKRIEEERRYAEQLRKSGE